MPKIELPAVGDTVWIVVEHLYHDLARRTGPLMEYCVCQGAVIGVDARGCTDIYVSVIGRRITDRIRAEYGMEVFYSPEAAAERAQEMTESYERTWAWLGPPDIPLRRPWAKYLMKGAYA